MDPEDLKREVEKIADALKWADNPLAAAIATARHSAERLVAILVDGTPPDLLEDK